MYIHTYSLFAVRVFFPLTPARKLPFVPLHRKDSLLCSLLLFFFSKAFRVNDHWAAQLTAGTAAHQRRLNNLTVTDPQMAFEALSEMEKRKKSPIKKKRNLTRFLFIWKRQSSSVVTGLPVNDANPAIKQIHLFIYLEK